MWKPPFPCTTRPSEIDAEAALHRVNGFSIELACRRRGTTDSRRSSGACRFYVSWSNTVSLKVENNDELQMSWTGRSVRHLVVNDEQIALIQSVCECILCDYLDLCSSVTTLEQNEQCIWVIIGTAIRGKPLERTTYWDCLIGKHLRSPALLLNRFLSLIPNRSWSCT